MRTTLHGDPKYRRSTRAPIVHRDRRAGVDRIFVAAAGRPSNQCNSPTQPVCFSAFDGEWCLEIAPKPEQCRLVRMGSLEDVAAEHPEIVQRLRAAAQLHVHFGGCPPLTNSN